MTPAEQKRSACLKRALEMRILFGRRPRTAINCSIGHLTVQCCANPTVRHGAIGWWILIMKGGQRYRHPASRKLVERMLSGRLCARFTIEEGLSGPRPYLYSE